MIPAITVNLKLPLPKMMKNVPKGLLLIRDVAMSHKGTFESEILGMYRGLKTISEDIFDEASSQFPISKDKIHAIVHTAENSARDCNREYSNMLDIMPDFSEQKVECTFYVYLDRILTDFEDYSQLKRIIPSSRVNIIRDVRDKIKSLNNVIEVNIRRAMSEARSKNRIYVECMIINHLFDFMVTHCELDAKFVNSLLRSAVDESREYLISLVEVERRINKKIPAVLLNQLITRIFTDRILTRLELQYSSLLN